MADTKNMAAETVVEADERKPLLEVKNLRKAFPIKKSLTGKVQQELIAVDNVSFDLYPGETLGIVGESVCGNTTLGRTILGLVPATSGEVWYNGRNIIECNKREQRELRKDLQIIFQDPYSSINPRLTVSEIIAEPMIVCGKYQKSEINDRVTRLMDTVGLADRLYNAYPHELDGGRRQRIGVARALSLNPRFIVCDEPVSALDVSIQAQIINLLKDLQKEYNLTYLFISHDLSVVYQICDRVAVLYHGEIVDQGDVDTVYDNPASDYTKRLLEASLALD